MLLGVLWKKFSKLIRTLWYSSGSNWTVFVSLQTLNKQIGFFKKKKKKKKPGEVSITNFKYFVGFKF